MLAVFSVYGVCVALALLGYLLGTPTSACSRPWGQTNLAAIGLTLASSGAVLLLGRALGVVYERRLQRELDAALPRS